MNVNYTYNGLGLVAGKHRILKDGKKFETLFTETLGTDPVVNKTASVYDTVDFVADVVKNTLKDTEKLAPVLKSSTIQQTLLNIHNFFYDHYQYKLDKPGVEQVRRPSRAFKDREKGIDCDCFSTSVSSVLTNLGIAHYLKIVALNGKDYFQHIYVIVPKFKNADITKRANYWVIDPVIDKEFNEKTSFDKEAKKITKTHTLKMSIPLQYLNGPDEDTLGNEFEGIEQELQGLGSNDDLGIASAFRNRVQKHVQNTIRKIDQNPTSVEAAFNAPRLRQQYAELALALDGPEDQLMQTLEKLSGEEHEALNDNLREFGHAVAGHDDYLYGALFGNLDENMLSSINGLGKKGNNRSNMQKANTGRKGQFTKIKNAVKLSKTANKNFGKKAGVVLKKVGKKIVKSNPISVAARAGFIVAMRTNLATIAERSFWGLQSRDFAKSKGISDDYYDACVRLYALTKKIFVNILKGDESALKSAILNGRAAKKVATVLKRQGMSGVEEVSGLGLVEGLGVVAAATSTAAATSFLVPIIAFVKKNFSSIKMVASSGTTFIKKRKDTKAGKSPKQDKKTDTVTNENGTKSEAPSTNMSDNINENVQQSKNPDSTINEHDGSIKIAAKNNAKDPGDDTNVNNEGEPTTSTKKSNTPLIIAGAVILIGGLVLVLKPKAKNSLKGIEEITGLGTSDNCRVAGRVLKKSSNKFLKSTAAKTLSKTCKKEKLKKVII